MFEATFSISRTDGHGQDAMTLSYDSIIVASKDLLFCDLSEGAVILDLESGVYYGLDAVGTYIWGLIQDPKVMNDIAAAVLEEDAVEPAQCWHDLKNLFAEMAERNLIEVRK